MRLLFLATFVLFAACGGPGQDRDPAETRKSAESRGNIVFSDIALTAPSPGQAGEIERVSRAYPELTDDEFVAEHRGEWLGG